MTGGSGFLGGALCRRLVADGYAVRSLSRRASPELSVLGVTSLQGDISNEPVVRAAVSGCDVVFHVAALAGVWGPAAEFERINIRGTEHVLAACRTAGVPRLIYTSSPSVAYAGCDEAGVDEAIGYPAHYLADYPRTKADAERLVLAANGPSLATVALRPHLIWGPGDNHLLPRLIDRAKAGRLRRIGDGKNLVDTTYIDNAVAAHCAALDRLQPGAACAGRAYFIANDEPRPLWELINALLACADVPPITRSVSARTAYVLGAVCETVYRVLGRTAAPPMTRFVARQLATAHWYDLTAAKRDLGYQPTVTVDEGLSRLHAALH